MRGGRIVLGALAVLLIVLVGASFWAERINTEETAQTFAYYTRLEQDMRAHLTIGTGYPQIAAYLQQKGIPYFYHPEDQLIYILFKNVQKNWIFSTDIQVVITLDDKQRLQSIVFRKVGTGP